MRMMLALAIIGSCSPAWAGPLTKAEQAMFVTSCTTDPSLRPYCECTVAELQKRMSADDIRRLGNATQQEVMNNDKFASAVAECASKIPRSSAAGAGPITNLEQKVFVKSCAEQDVSMTRYCECTLNELMKRMSADEFRRIGQGSETDQMNDERIASAVAECADKLP